ncbi:MAG: SprB repeat-containing protein, partial [Nitrospinaceae bacterium]|nr:SprB repeat-containing protein [Nitrospinaceae bacterium]
MQKIKIIALLFCLPFCGFLSESATGETTTCITKETANLGVNHAPASKMLTTHSVVFTTYSTTCKDSCDGAIKATVIGGVGPFGFDWVGGPDGDGTDSVYNLCGGPITLFVIDSGDGDDVIIAIPSVPEPPQIGHFFLTTDSTDCFGECSGDASTLVSGGNGGFTHIWSPSGETTLVADSLCPGDNTILSTDVLGCTGVDTVFIEQPPVLAANVAGIGILCNGVCTGQAQSVPTGGSPPYTHSWNTGSTNDTLFNLCIGTYADTVRDVKGCISIGTFIVSQPLAMTLTMDSTNQTCGVLCNGVARVTVGGGTGPFGYLWNDPLAQTNDSAFALCAGMYTVIVTDAAGCSDTDSVQVNAPPVLTLSMDSTDVICFGESNGTVTAIPGGGTPSLINGYTFIWDDPGLQTNATAIGLAVGCYSVTVTDSLLCTIFGTICVGEPPVVDVTIVGVNLLCDSVCIGTATATPTGGVGGFGFSWDTSPIQTNATATGLCADTFMVTVTDANLCTDTASIIITAPPPLTTTMAQTDESCTGDCDGTGTVTPGGGVGPYAFAWSNFDTSPTAGSLCSGKAFVTVTDFNGCTTVDSVDIVAATPMSVTTDTTNVTCGGACDGQSEAFPVGGLPPYAYVWTPPVVQTTKIAVGLCAGTHEVRVIDDNGCQDSIDVIITEPPVLTIGMDSTAVTCFGDSNGTAICIPGGGTPPYAYIWDDPGFQTDSIATGLKTGCYNVTITDALLCTITGSLCVGEPAILTAFISFVQDLTCAAPPCDGQATASVTGGSGPYTFLWNDIITGPSTGTFAPNLCAGLIGFIVEDSLGCDTTAVDSTVTEPIVLSVIMSKTDELCAGSGDGTATATPSGGTGLYTYLWDDAGAQTTSTATGLSCGFAQVTITDFNGCTLVDNIELICPTPLTVTVDSTDATCGGVCDGEAEANPVGGTGAPYTFIWDNPDADTDSIADSLCAGIVRVTVTDLNGCTVNDSTTIVQPIVLGLTMDSVLISCNGSGDGTGTANPSGGTPFLIPPAYTYVWNTFPVQTTKTAIILIAGTWCVTVTDSIGCTISDCVVQVDPPVLTVSTSHTDALCNGDCTGSGTATAGGGTGAYAYVWCDGQTTSTTLLTLCAGVCGVTVTDANGCTITGSETIDEPTGIIPNITTTPSTCGNPDGIACVTPSGGTPAVGPTPYSIEWFFPGPPFFGNCTTGVAAGTYRAEIIDDNGCRDTAVVFVSDIASHTVVMSDTDITCFGANDGIGLGLAVGGTPGYTYLWLDNVGVPLPGPIIDSNITGLGPGTYVLQIDDALSCTIFDSIQITEPTLLLANLTSVDVLCSGDNNGSVCIAPSGGTPPYTFVWGNGCVTTCCTSLFPGSYDVTLTDNNGCTVLDTAVVQSQPLLSINQDTVHLSCFGDSDGQGIATPVGGVGPYAYLWNTIPPQTDSIATGLIAGNYCVTVTDANACTDTACVTVLEPPLLTLTLGKRDVSCFGICDGTDTANVAGGTGPGTYSFLWSDGQVTSTAVGLCDTTFMGVTVTDANSCTVSASNTILEPVVLGNTVTVNSNVSCFGLSDGSATAAPTGGSGVYTFIWSNGDITPVAGILSVGTWYVTINDGSCTLVDSAVITEPPVLALTMDSTDLACNGIDTGKAHVHPTGGTGPYTFLWDAATGNQSDSTATGLAPGCYFVTVTDVQGCTAIDSVCVTEPLAMTPGFTTVDATCGVCDGLAASSPLGGTGPGTYTFNWYDPFSPSPAGNDTIFNQCAGFKNLELTDGNSCIDTFTVGVNNFGAPIIDSLDSTGVTCFGDCDGTATVYIQAFTGTPPYTITWTNPDTGVFADSLCAGPVFVSVEDAIGCVVVGSTTITTPTEIISLISGVNVSCFGLSDGEARTAPSGGTPPYTHIWTPVGANIDTLKNVIAGTYIDTIADFTGCFIVDTIVITQPGDLNITLASDTNITCNGLCNGSIVAIAVGGTKQYTYAWNDPALQVDSFAIGICADTATKVVVTDANGCKDSLTHTLTQPLSLTSSITLTTNISCFGLNDGTAIVTPAGGSAPYTYLWDNNPDFDTDSLAGSLFSDTLYTVAIEDSLGCQDTTTVTLSQPALLMATITDSTNISCNGVCDGTAVVTPGGGTGIYTFLWDDPATQANDTAIGLCADSLYRIIVSDSFGCTAIDSVMLTAPGALSVTISDSTNISCFGLSDGMAVGLATGGATPYTYTWSPPVGLVDDTITGLSAGTVDTLVVVDSNACTDTAFVTLSEPGVLSITVTDSVNASCFGTCDGIARTITVGGTAPYTYDWVLTSDSLDSAIVLCADTMNIVIVTDSNSCTAQDSVMLSQPLEIFSIITDSTDASCFDVCDGQAVMVGFGGNPPLTFSWQSGESGTTADSLCAKDTLYGVVLDSLGCTDSAFLTISEPPEIVITFTDSSAALCDGGCEGNVTAALSGGTPPLTILWSNGDTGLTADSLCAGSIVITVTDVLGCSASDSLTIVAPTPFVVDTVSTTSAACDSTCDAVAIVFGTGGNTPYTFNWDNGDTGTTADSLCASTYIVTATDSNGCITMDTIVIVGPDSLSSAITDTTMISCTGLCDGSATASGSGGVSGFTYTWTDSGGTVLLGPGVNDTTITGLCAGLYYAVVRDANGCITTAPVTITEPAPLAANVCDTNNVSCNSSCDGSAKACPQGGTGPYTFLWDDSLAQVDSIADNLCAGVYAVTVTDANGCVAEDSLIVIAEPTFLSCLFPADSGTGCGLDSATGFAVAAGNGGIPPYNYSWNTTPTDTNDTLSNLLAGNYSVTVTDNNGCTSNCGITITDTSNMAASIIDSTMISCAGSCDGGAVVVSTGSTLPHTYNWEDYLGIATGDITNTATGLCEGWHRVIVKSAAACFRSIPLEITEPDSLDAVISDTLLPLCNADSNG